MDQFGDHAVTETSASADSKHSPELASMSNLRRQDSSPSGRRLQHSPISADMVSGRELIDSVREKSVGCSGVYSIFGNLTLF